MLGVDKWENVFYYGKMSKDLTIPEAAAQLNLSNETVRRYCVSRLFNGVYRTSPVKGARWRIPQSAVESFKRARENGR